MHKHGTGFSYTKYVITCVPRRPGKCSGFLMEYRVPYEPSRAGRCSRSHPAGVRPPGFLAPSLAPLAGLVTIAPSLAYKLVSFTQRQHLQWWVITTSPSSDCVMYLTDFFPSFPSRGGMESLPTRDTSQHTQLLHQQAGLQHHGGHSAGKSGHWCRVSQIFPPLSPSLSPSLPPSLPPSLLPYTGILPNQFSQPHLPMGTCTRLAPPDASEV